VVAIRLNWRHIAIHSLNRGLLASRAADEKSVLWSAQFATLRMSKIFPASKGGTENGLCLIFGPNSLVLTVGWSSTPKENSMKKSCLVLKALVAIATLSASVQWVAAQEGSPSTGPAVTLVVSVEARRGSSVPDIGRQDVMVYEGRDRDKVTAWLPLQGNHAGLELFVLLDDSSSFSLGSKLEDIRAFIGAQPATTKIGIAYMQNGAAQVAQNLTGDRTLASKALRLPLGDAGVNASPYFSLGDLIKRWPESHEPREVLMITDGIDGVWGSGPGDAYVDSVVDQAQRAGVVVFGIYTPGAGHDGHSSWRMNWGQNYLSQVADETGGEAYYLGYDAPVSFAPYLEDITHRLSRQYLLTFLAKPQKKAGLQRVKLRTEVPNAELVSADKVYVPATQE